MEYFRLVRNYTRPGEVRVLSSGFEALRFNLYTGSVILVKTLLHKRKYMTFEV